MSDVTRSVTILIDSAVFAFTAMPYDPLGIPVLVFLESFRTTSAVFLYLYGWLAFGVVPTREVLGWFLIQTARNSGLAIGLWLFVALGKIAHYAINRLWIAVTTVLKKIFQSTARPKQE